MVTNPPFSLFREYTALMMEHNKKFIVVGSLNAVTYKETFPLIMENKLWLGVNKVKEFVLPDGTTKKFGNILWYTNLEHNKRTYPIDLYKRYDRTPEDFPKYDNSNIINVSRVSDIPEDYTGVMGVPITFLENYCPTQFEVLGLANSARYLGNVPCLTIIDGKAVYNRILIRHKNPRTEPY